MNIWANTVVTSKGVSLLAKLTQGHTLDIKKAEVGTGFVTPGLLAAQTKVTDPMQTLVFRPVSYPEEGVCAMPVVLTNEGLETGYEVTQVGVYAEDPDEGTILFFIAQSVAADDGTVVPSEKEMPGYSAEWTFYLRYGQADSVNVMVDPTHAVARAEMEDYVNATINVYATEVRQKFEEIDAYIESSNEHFTEIDAHMEASNEHFTEIDAFMEAAQERLGELDGREAFYAQNEEPADAEEGAVWLDLDEGEGDDEETIVDGGSLPPVTEEDNDMILQVIGGVWTKTQIAGSAFATYIDNYINEALGGDY